MRCEEREDTASTLIVHLLAYPTVDALRRWETPDIINGFARTLDLTQGNFIGKPQIVLNLAEQLKRKMQPSDYMWAHMNRLLSAQILMANISLGETNISLNSLKAAKYCLRHFTNFFLVRDYKLDPDDLKTWEKTLESARAKEVSWVPLLERVTDKKNNRFKLTQNRIVYTEFGSALRLITTAEPGKIEDFIDVLQEKLDEKLEGNPPDAPTLTDITLT